MAACRSYQSESRSVRIGRCVFRLTCRFCFGLIELLLFFLVGKDLPLFVAAIATEADGFAVPLDGSAIGTNLSTHDRAICVRR